MLVHLIDFVLCCIESFKIGTDLGLRTHAIICRNCHVPTLVVTVLKSVSLNRPIDWLGIKSWLLRKQLVSLPIINLLVPCFLLINFPIVFLLNLLSFVVWTGFLDRDWDFVLLGWAVFEAELVCWICMQLVGFQKLLDWSCVEVFLWQVFLEVHAGSYGGTCGVVSCTLVHLKLIKVFFKISLKAKIILPSLG